MNLTPILITLLVVAIQQDKQPAVPVAVDQCMADRVTAGSVQIVFATNPFYLRGDFDGDRRPDYAISITGVKTLRQGILICLANKKMTLIGGDNTASTSIDFKNSSAPQWFVKTRDEVIALNKPGEEPLPVPRGEVISMVWEDAAVYLYWDGTRFRWSPEYQ